MTFYQELQLNQAGSKALIRAGKSKKEKHRHIIILNIKACLTMMFCMVFISLYTLAFGAENSIAGVGILLSVMAFRFVDLGFNLRHSVAVLMGIFGILAIGPRLANLSGPVPAFFINMVCILSLTFLACHNPVMGNHSILVLTYLLLYGYDVSGAAYAARVAGLVVGGAYTAFILYRNHRKIQYKRSFRDLFREFRFDSTRGRWQLQLAIGIPSAMLLAQLLGLQRVMWVGFAAMSVMQPFASDARIRSVHRMGATVVGCLFTFILYLFIPQEQFALIGLLGGICVSYCATYFWQSVFNVFGALATAVGLFGISGAIAYRIMDNAFGILFAVAFALLFQRIISSLSDRLTASGAGRASEA